MRTAHATWSRPVSFPRNAPQTEFGCDLQAGRPVFQPRVYTPDTATHDPAKGDLVYTVFTQLQPSSSSSRYYLHIIVPFIRPWPNFIHHLLDLLCLSPLPSPEANYRHHLYCLDMTAVFQTRQERRDRACTSKIVPIRNFAGSLKVWFRVHVLVSRRGNRSKQGNRPAESRKEPLGLAVSCTIRTILKTLSLPRVINFTVWRTWLFIAYSDQRWPILTTSLIHFST